MFAMQLSGRMTVELNPPQRQVPDLRRVLERLDGEARFSVVVFPLPAGARLDDVDPTTYASGYLQCAGSTQRMTLEMCEHDGLDYRQYVIARGPRLDPGPDEVIRWGSFETRVNPAEVFTSAQAIEVFAEYLEKGSVPQHLHRRLLTL